MVKEKGDVLVRIPAKSKEQLEYLTSGSNLTQTEILGRCIDFFYENKNYSVFSIQENLQKMSSDLTELKKLIERNKL